MDMLQYETGGMPLLTWGYPARAVESLAKFRLEVDDIAGHVDDAE
jgi:hypothetical protein